MPALNIKAAALSRAISSSSCPIQEKILHTGQHYDASMSDQFFSELGLPVPAFHLGIGGGSHGANTGRMLEAIENVLLDEKPDVLLVYGDTDSTLAGSLAASKLKIPVVHVEAGLRSFNRGMPEEQNRILTDHLSELCFAPSITAMDHLRREGISEERIIFSGDVMADVARIFGDRAEVSANQLLSDKDFQALGSADSPFILETIHRAENTDDPHRLKAVLSSLAEFATKGSGQSPNAVVLPIHPRTRARIKAYDLGKFLHP